MRFSVISIFPLHGIREWQVILDGGIASQVCPQTYCLRIDLISTVYHGHLDDISPLSHFPRKPSEGRGKVPAVSAPAGVKLDHPGVLLVGDCLMEVGVIEDDHRIPVTVQSRGPARGTDENRDNYHNNEKLHFDSIILSSYLLLTDDTLYDS